MKRTLATVTLGEEDTVVVRRSGRHDAIVAKALDIVRDEDGTVRRILLDRRVHKGNEDWDGKWRASGARVTLLERCGSAAGA